MRLFHMYFAHLIDNFRYTLVGTHIINSIHKYMYTPLTKKEREAEDRKRSLNQLRTIDGIMVAGNQSPSLISGVTDDKEKSPLLPRDITISFGNL